MLEPHTYGQGQFQELCWLKAVIPEISLVRRAQRVKRKNKLLRSTQHYYISNFDIVVSFGATEFKCYVEWKDKKVFEPSCANEINSLSTLSMQGKTQQGPVTPVWNDDPEVASAQTTSEMISNVYQGTNLGERDSSTTFHSMSSHSRRSTVSSVMTDDLESLPSLSPAYGYLQRDRERLPRLPQAQIAIPTGLPGAGDPIVKGAHGRQRDLTAYPQEEL
ncbi:hypothetical protein FRC02_011562 [Tulasnella sp. 418]|nr:hypothetical protein FRC02_011562 [Tulasnella sp. 418]